jgi:hypothetical protein
MADLGKAWMLAIDDPCLMATPGGGSKTFRPLAPNEREQPIRRIAMRGVTMSSQA